MPAANEARWAIALIEPLITFSIALVAVLVLRHLLLWWLRRQAKGPGSFPFVFAETIGFPSVLWCLAVAIEISLRFAQLSRASLRLAANLIEAFIIISLTLVASSVAVRTMTAWGERQEVPFALAGASRALVRVLIFLIGAATLLANLGKAITPLLTTLGVAGLAVALALQDTLGNFFAGLHILLERPISVGDLIRLDAGYEGTVTDIGWRTTRLRTGANDIVVVPNTKITSGILVNYSLPDQRTVLEVPVLAAHEADPDEVARIILEEAARTEGILAHPAPVLLCDPGVMLTHLQLKLIVHVPSRAEQGRVLSDIRMRLLRRFRAEGILLPGVERLALKPWADANRG